MALRGTLRHRKTRKLGKLLGIPPCFALGILEAMWHVTAALFPTGAIGRMSNDEIADQLDYTGDAETLVAALVEAELLDEHRMHRLIVHDWHQHSDNTLDATLYRKGFYYANGSMPRGTKLDEKKKAVLFDQFYRKPADSLFDIPEKQTDVSVPNPALAAEEIPGVNVLPIDGLRAHAATAPHGAAKRLPEPEPEPVPEPVPTTPTPPLSRRGAQRDLQVMVERGRETDGGQALDAAARHVVECCSFSGVTGVRMQVSIWMAIEAECKRVDKPPDEHAMEVAEYMVRGYLAYVKDGDLMRFTWGPKKFFEEGHWRSSQGWPIDRKELERQRNANHGSSYLN